MKRNSLIIFLIIILLHGSAIFSWCASLPEEAFIGNIENGIICFGCCSDAI